MRVATSIGRIALLVGTLDTVASAAEQGIAAPGATLEKLAGGFAFTEGPTSDAAGNVYFTDQPNDRIVVWSVDDRLSTFMQPAGRANGLAFDAQGNLWVCADAQNELWKVGPDKEVEIVVRRYAGRLLNGPNDVWISPAGQVYFTDPFYKRPYWQRGAMEQDVQGVHRLDPKTGRVERIISDLVQPNGIIGTPDGKTLYVADIGAGTTYEYTTTPDGPLKDKKLFCSMGSDGLTLDDLGNVYLTGKGVTVFDRSGREIDHIDVPEPWTANVCFGGPDHGSLFITASQGLYRLRTHVKGVSTQ